MAYGGGGNDQMQGGTGADSLYGGTGNDALTGGGDNDDGWYNITLQYTHYEEGGEEEAGRCHPRPRAPLASS